MIIKEGDIIKHHTSENSYIVLKVLDKNQGYTIQRIVPRKPSVPLSPVAFTCNFIERNFSLIQLAEMGRFACAV